MNELIPPKQYVKLYSYLEDTARLYTPHEDVFSMEYDFSFCNGRLSHTQNWLERYAEDLEYKPTLRRIIALGGRCDCEVLRIVRPWRYRKYPSTGDLSPAMVDLYWRGGSHRDEWSKYITLVFHGAIESHLRQSCNK